jgi:hypothetical protein
MAQASQKADAQYQAKTEAASGQLAAQDELLSQLSRA